MHPNTLKYIQLWGIVYVACYFLFCRAPTSSLSTNFVTFRNFVITKYQQNRVKRGVHICNRTINNIMPNSHRSQQRNQRTQPCRHYQSSAMLHLWRSLAWPFCWAGAMQKISSLGSSVARASSCSQPVLYSCVWFKLERRSLWWRSTKHHCLMILCMLYAMSLSLKKAILLLSRKTRMGRYPFQNGSSAQQPGAWYRKRSAIGSMGWKPVHKMNYVEPCKGYAGGFNGVYRLRTHHFILCTG